VPPAVVNAIVGLSLLSMCCRAAAETIRTHAVGAIVEGDHHLAVHGIAEQAGMPDSRGSR
jgi:hypothetical protein